MNSIAIKNRRCSLEKLQRDEPHARIVDVTSKAEEPWVRFSPFYPHGGIPVPNCAVTSASVEGLWQGLKVFENTGIDTNKFSVTNMKGLKRTVRRFGNVRGHRYGVDGDELLGYREARYKIYLPAYRWVLEEKLSREIEELRQLMNEQPIIFLDYETNTDMENLEKPLSHAGLIRAYLLGEWPSRLMQNSPVA